MAARPMDNSESTGLDDYRVSAPAEISAILKRFAEHNAHVSVNAPNGTSLRRRTLVASNSRSLIASSASLGDVSGPRRYDNRQ